VFSLPGGTPLYKPYRYVPAPKGRVLRRFGLKMGMDFAHFVEPNFNPSIGD